MTYSVVDERKGFLGQVDRCRSLLVAIDRAMSRGHAAVVCSGPDGSIVVLYATGQQSDRLAALEQARGILEQRGIEEFA